MLLLFKLLEIAILLLLIWTIFMLLRSSKEQKKSNSHTKSDIGNRFNPDGQDISDADFEEIDE